MKKFKKLLAVLLTFAMLASLNCTIAFADEDSVIAEFDSSALTVGETDDAAKANRSAFLSSSFSLKNTYDPTNTDYVNKLYAVDGYNGRSGKILKIKQDAYTGTADYNHNMPYIHYTVSASQKFYAEAWVLSPSTTVQITLRGTNTAGNILEKSQKMDGTSSAWVKLGIAFDPQTQIVTYYKNGFVEKTESVTYDTTKNISIRYITLFGAGSAESPANNEVYWDGFKILNDAEVVYVDSDFTNQTTSGKENGLDTMLAVLKGSIAPAGAGAYGNSLSLTATNDYPSWMVTNKEEIFKNDFVSEFSVCMADGSSLFFGFRDSANAESPLIKLEKGGVYAGKANTKCASYVPGRWYYITSVYHKDANTTDVYVNGKLAKENVSTGVGTGCNRFNFTFMGINNNGKTISLRYIKIYKASSFDASGYTTANVASSDSSKTAVNGNTVTTKCSTLAELKETLSGAENAKLYNSSFAETEYISNNGIMTNTSDNGKVIDYYTVRGESLNISKNGENVEANAVMVNGDYVIILAEYNSDKSVLISTSIGKTDGNTINLNYTEGNKYKVFVFDSMENIKPICRSIDLTE